MIDIFQGDCMAILPTLPAQSVQCCVTSPPYWGLRDYGTATWEGGDAECRHIESTYPGTRDGLAKLSERMDGRTRGEWESSKALERAFKDICGHCGARRIDAQLGLESTPEEYVANMVSVFREVWRVLCDDGTLWLNLGDSYAAGGQNSGSNPEDLTDKQRSNAGCRYERRIAPNGLKPKDLCGIPWRVAFALQSDGWYLRSDIIWAKPNPMPESVTDRPTKSHEYIFLLSKSAKYYYDADAIREKGNGFNGSSFTSGWDRSTRGFSVSEKPRVETEFRNKRTVWTIATQPNSDLVYDFEAADYVDRHGIPRKWSPDCSMHERDGQLRRESLAVAACDAPEGISHYDNGHIDVRPEIKLPVVDGATSRYKNYPAEDSFSCAQLDDISESKKSDDLDEAERGKQFHTKRIQSLFVPSMMGSDRPSYAQIATSHSNGDRKNGPGDLTLGDGNASEQLEFHIEYMEPRLYGSGSDGNIGANNTNPCNDHPKSTVEIVSRKNGTYSSIEDKCLCRISQVAHFATFPEDLIKPCILAGSKPGDTVLDPFGGSGTTAKVALELGRRAVLIELNPAYVEMAKERTNVTHGML